MNIDGNLDVDPSNQRLATNVHIKREILQCENKLGRALWWTDYLMETLYYSFS